jgi:Tol biopolymer transport system component
MKKIFVTLCLFIVFIVGYAQVSPAIQLGDSARIFGKDVISTGDFVFNPSFTPDNKTVFFSKATVNFGYIAIFYATKKGTSWTTPQAVSFTGIYRDSDPFVSADGKRLYFSSDRPVNGKPFRDFVFHCFYVELNRNKVASEPVLLDLSIPDNMKAAYYTFADNGNAYYFSIDSSGDADIYMSEFKNGGYLPPVALPFNDKKFFDFDPVIAREESFIIFCSPNRTGFGSEDLWVSFKKEKTWTEPVNMGSNINTKGSEAAPSLSKDNKTLYFSAFREATPRPVYKDGKITTQAVNDLLHSTKNGIRSIYEIGIVGLGE